MKVWGIVLFLFIFSAFSTLVESYGGVGGVHVNDVGLDTSEIESMGADIYELDENGEPLITNDEEVSLIAGAKMLLKSFVVFVKIILNTVFIYGVLISYGVPTAIAAMVQGITNIIQVVGIVQFASNRKVESR